MVEHYIFDIDGTIIDSRDGMLRALQTSLASVGISYDLSHLHNIGFGPPLREILETLIADGEKRVLAERAFRAAYDTEGIFESVVYPDIQDLLSAIRCAGKSVSFFTANNDVVVMRLLRMHRLLHQHDIVKASQTQSGYMSKTESVTNILRERSCIASEVVVVGDTDADFHAARANNLRFIGAGYGYKGSSFLRKLGVEQIAESPKHLVSLLMSINGRHK